MAESNSKAAQDLSEFMETTMQNLQSKFQAMSDQIVSRNILYISLPQLPDQRIPIIPAVADAYICLPGRNGGTSDIKVTLSNTKGESRYQCAEVGTTME
ncbi:hypothetical protein MATL_G00235180 [Megalops atlanticus]|uniref:Uncharacterized protein n=1 Tax=Megalops atlanticus TaxID=7932 RepID=A0A9D3T2P4_MEGAT|nr:hypothetical protein MATL_G00235180 [Megalops atlanticus]